MLSEREIEESARSREPYRGFQLLHFEEIFKIDVFLLNDSPFERSEFERRVARELEDGFRAYYFTAEDTVLRKLVWYLMANRSDRQWNDVVGILEVRRGLLDLAYMRRWAPELGVSAELEEAIVQAAVVDEPEE